MQNQSYSLIDLIHDSRHVGFAIIMQISYTFLKGQTTQVREVITNILATQMNEGVVYKETVVLRRWGSSIQKFGFINGVDNVNWPPYRDSKS